MIRRVVIRQSDGFVLRYGYCDWAAGPEYDPVTEAIIVSNFIFDPDEPLESVAWYWDGATFTQTSPWSDTLSVLFDGVNEHVDYGNPAALQLTAAITVSLWVKGAPQNYAAFCSKWSSLTNERSWVIRSGTGATGDQIEILLSASGSLLDKRYESSATALDGTWHHVAFTFTANTLRIYLDGAEDVSVTKIADAPVTNLHNSSTQLYSATINDATGQWFAGNQDEFSVWSAVLTPGQVAEIYNGGAPADLSTHSAAGSLVAWWRMGDGDTFPTLADAVGSADGAMTNMEIGDIVPDVA